MDRVDNKIVIVRAIISLYGFHDLLLIKPNTGT